MAETISSSDESKFVYHVLRYTSDLIRDEWVNIGVMLFDPLTGALRLRLIEEQDEYARIRRLDPAAVEHTLRAFLAPLEDRFTSYPQNMRTQHGPQANAVQRLQSLVENWSNSLSNGVQ